MKVLLLFVAMLTLPCGYAEAFEVKGKAVSTTFCVDGKCETAKCEDEVIYEIDLRQSTVTRKAVLVKSKDLQKQGLGGPQADNTLYQIIYDQSTLVGGSKTRSNPQRVIKGIGQCGALDGFEILVIGEDFIHTSRSTSEYFVLYYYRRDSR